MFQIRLTQIMLLLALVVVSLGAYTRLKDAGLGCPDWPGCYGRWIVPAEVQDPFANAVLPMSGANSPYVQLAPPAVEKAWIEMIHRYAAGFLGFGILVLAVLSLKQKPKQTLPWLLVGLVVFQAALGMWTVTLKLYPIVVMSHLLGGLLITMGICWFLLEQKGNKGLLLDPALMADRGIQQKSNQNNFMSLKNLALLSLIVLFIQVIFGGWTSANYAALVCLDFPLCHGMTNPPMAWQEAFNVFQAGNPGSPGAPLGYLARATIHMMHRYWAVITTGILLFTWVRLWNNGYNRWWLAILMGLLAFQIALGITNVIAFLPLPSAWMHHLVAVLLLLSWLSVFRTCLQSPKTI